ncbi:hypothetical protein [Nocardiopsis ansamitocini]|uniref:Uncharacterized protein n=1 Tax=Nocardiopsis ansamitocini TaxID=1670832 RepID=A0A9W6UH61_9ACTN|nr:hypothetical protein [Nocardiopsis ansamitocini]GLU46294.1 hypothetical protein Nans01_06450 [Nocardiopsis ansamitocini]
MQTYDLHKFLGEVRDILERDGIRPQRGDDQPLPEVAAGMLLRAYGVEPVMNPVDGLRNSMDKPWVDEDESRSSGTDTSR